MHAYILLSTYAYLNRSLLTAYVLVAIYWLIFNNCFIIIIRKTIPDVEQNIRITSSYSIIINYYANTL